MLIDNLVSLEFGPSIFVIFFFFLYPYVCILLAINCGLKISLYSRIVEF